MKIYLDDGAFEPVRAHETDAGLDIRSPKGVTIFPESSEVIHTGVHVEIPKGCAGLLVSKSGLNVKFEITTTGLIDEGYTGEIVVRVFNHRNGHYYIAKGDKITQLVVIPVRYEPVELVSEIWESDGRGDKGFGSTGR